MSVREQARRAQRSEWGEMDFRRTRATMGAVRGSRREVNSSERRQCNEEDGVLKHTLREPLVALRARARRRRQRWPSERWRGGRR